MQLAAAVAASAANTSAQIITCAGFAGCFNPNPIRITTGSTVTWTNATGLSHTATSNTGGWDTGTIAAGATSGPLVFPTAGTFAYRCAIHQTMLGTVIVSAVAAPATPSPGVRRLAAGGGGPGRSIEPGLYLFGAALAFSYAWRLLRKRRISSSSS